MEMSEATRKRKKKHVGEPSTVRTRGARDSDDKIPNPPARVKHGPHSSGESQAGSSKPSANVARRPPCLFWFCVFIYFGTFSMVQIVHHHSSESWEMFLYLSKSQL